MVKSFINLLYLLIVVTVITRAQQIIPSANIETSTIHKIEAINWNIENAVLRHDIFCLDTLYEADFIFSHGSGKVETKSQWLESIKSGKSRYVSRELDSVAVELHNDIALVTGRIIIQSEPISTQRIYGIRFIRVFAYRNNRWQLLSHRTLAQWNIQHE
jgi:hypothetical protein